MDIQYLISQVGISGVMVWIVWYLLSRVQPKRDESFLASSEKISTTYQKSSEDISKAFREDMREERDANREARRRDRETLEKLAEKINGMSVAVAACPRSNTKMNGELGSE